MLAMHTNANNSGIAPPQMVERFKAIETLAMFDLWQITADVVRGEWTGRIKSPDQLARELAELCPNVLDDFDSVAKFAKSLKVGGEFQLWWD